MAGARESHNQIELTTDRLQESVRMKLRIVGLLLVVFGSLALVLVPAYLIQPFAPQTPGEVALSYHLRAWSPLGTLALLVLGGVLLVRLWAASRSILGKIPLVAAGLLLGAGAFLARQNHFEWMFQPLPHPGFVEAGRASEVEDADMVLAVEAGGQAKAYPVRLMAYHHVVNDEVGSQPIVATY
jgi:uncharacterized protein DUF3179